MPKAKKKIANPSTPCYEYLDQIRPYYNNPSTMYLALESKFGIGQEEAKRVLLKWLDYADRNIEHPWERKKFLNWRYEWRNRPVADNA